MRQVKARNKQKHRVHECIVAAQAKYVDTTRGRAGHEEGRGANAAQTQHVQVELRDVPNCNPTVRSRVAYF
jgi:hypothetical protein